MQRVPDIRNLGYIERSERNAQEARPSPFPIVMTATIVGNHTVLAHLLDNDLKLQSAR